MVNVPYLKAAVAKDPMRFLVELYGPEAVRQVNEQTWRVGRRGGKVFDTKKGELLACDYTGDEESGDCLSVWCRHLSVPFAVAVAQLAGLYEVSVTGGAGLVPKTA